MSDRIRAKLVVDVEVECDGYWGGYNRKEPLLTQVVRQRITKTLGEMGAAKVSVEEAPHA